MKGYVTQQGYMGYVPDTNGKGSYILFSCEKDYEEYISESEGNDNE